MTRHIHLTAEDGLEGFLPVLLPLLVQPHYNVVELLDAEHIAMVCHGHALHAVLPGLVYKFLDARLSVEY